MIPRFYLYSFFKNMRFADPFLVLYFLDLKLSFTEIGLLLGLQHLVTVLLEFPSGILADNWGRRRTTALCFVFYTLAFAGFGMTKPDSEFPLSIWLSGCVVLFALGEALRTGSHKAIMLDYLDSSGQSHLATQLISHTRSVSKFSSASAAILGGLLLSWTREYSVLFFLSAVASFCGVVLMWTYPKSLEGDVYRERQHGKPEEAPSAQTSVMDSGLKKRLRAWNRPEFRAILLQSILFESQMKIILKYFTQPFLKAGLGLFGIPIIAPSAAAGIESAGAFWVGLNEFIRDGLGGLGARISPRFQQFAGSGFAALNGAYLGGLVAVFGLAVCAWNLKWGLFPGLVILVLLTILQNLRRPIFVSTLNLNMEKQQRATVLSLESFTRAVSVAVLLPCFGWAADRYGLFAVWGLSSALLLAGTMLKLNGNGSSTPTVTPSE